MIRKIFKIINNLIINNIRFVIIKLLNPRKFFFGFKCLISPLVTIDIQDKSMITINNGCKINKFSSLETRENGEIILNKNVFINTNCKFVCHEKIEVGEGTSIGPNVVFMDHDHKYSKEGIIPGKYNKGEIIIGKNVWIGANCIILKGTHIGDNCVIAAGSVVKCDIPNNQILIQKRDNYFKRND